MVLRPLAVGALVTSVAVCIMIMTKMFIVLMCSVYLRPLTVGALMTTVAACIMIMTKMFIVLMFCVPSGPWLWEPW